MRNTRREFMGAMAVLAATTGLSSTRAHAAAAASEPGASQADVDNAARAKARRGTGERPEDRKPRASRSAESELDVGKRAAKA
jgi:hypothetical protein